MLKGYRTMLFPNKQQQELIIKFCNASRFAYNWALAYEKENYEKGNKFISGYDMTKIFTQLKKQEDYLWLKEISARALKVSILNACESYQNFFKGKSKHPKFKTKKNSKMKCATHEGTTVIEKKRIRLEKLGWVKCHKHNIPIYDSMKIYNPKIEFDGLNYWFACSIDTDDYKIHKINQEKTEPIGIDLGIKTLATCSNGKNFKRVNIKRIEKRLKKLKRRASKRYAEMIKISKETKTKFHKLQKSKNLIKLEKKILKLEQHITNIRKNNLHEITSTLIKLNPSHIVIEDLNVSGMKKNKHLSKAITDCSFYEFRRQLEYKCKWNDIELVIADRWFPSSKLCSCCGNKKDKLSLSERTYICEHCGLVIDRDYNASLNLKNLVMSN